MDFRISPKERFDSAMCDFSVLNHLQVGIVDIIELIFFNDNFVVAFRAAYSYLLCRLADGVVRYYFFKLE
jgi:hypothetical protein